MPRNSVKEHKIRNIILKYVEQNIKSYLILLIIFFIGIVLGVIFINNANTSQSDQISNYINNFINSIKEEYKVGSNQLLWKSIINNLCIAAILWFLGSTVIGIPLIYLSIGYKGFCMGYTISSIIAVIGIGKGILFIASTMLFQNIIIIPAILTLAVSGIKLYKLIMEDRRSQNIKLQILRHTVFSAFILVILVGASFIETYISGNLATIFLRYC